MATIKKATHYDGLLFHYEVPQGVDVDVNTGTGRAYIWMHRITREQLEELRNSIDNFLEKEGG